MLLKPARSVEKYIPLFDKQPKKTVLDYGSGNLRNSIYLHKKGYRVIAIDLPHRIKFDVLPRLTCALPEEVEHLNIKADIAICTFVLNLISNDDRVSMINTIAGKMIKGGYFLIETRGFTQRQLDVLIIPRGFVRVHNQRGKYTIIALYQYLGQ